MNRIANAHTQALAHYHHSRGSVSTTGASGRARAPSPAPCLPFYTNLDLALLVIPSSFYDCVHPNAPDPPLSLAPSICADRVSGRVSNALQ